MYRVVVMPNVRRDIRRLPSGGLIIDLNSRNQRARG